MTFDDDERDETPREDEATEPEEDAPQADPPAGPPQAGAPEPGGEEVEAEPAGAPEPAGEEVEAEPEAGAPEPAGEEVEAEPAGGDAQEADRPEAEAPGPQAGDAARERPRRERGPKKADSEPEVIPGAHLEPDLVLEDIATAPEEVGEQTAAEIEAAEAALAEEDGAAVADEEAPAQEAPTEPTRRPTTVIELAADARYHATGKRKSAVARVTLKPGSGAYTINGRELERFFPRPTLQRVARDPLETVGQQGRMDVVAQIHGGGVSAQAGALRHGVARALVEADPNLRGELKRHGFLTRDPRVKERKKAGLKKARKRPQFSKR